MNDKLQNILDIIQQSEKPDAELKENLLKAVRNADKEFEIISFKLDRTEKVKKTTAILLEETIEELEHKRKAVEEQNHELEIEAALERVRAIALSMKQPAEMAEVCKTISDQLQFLGVNDIRNVQTAIINDHKSSYLNYQYFSVYKKAVIEEAEYNKHPKAKEMAETMKKSANAFYNQSFENEELNVFRQYRKGDNQFPDPILDKAIALHFYFYSIGHGALGISTYNTPLREEDLILLKRFRNVFELAYRRFKDIENAEAQAREAQIEAALERVRSRTMGMQKSDELKEVIQLVYEQFVYLGIHIEHTGFIMDYKARDDMHIWLADRHEVPSEIIIPYFDSPHWNSFNEAKEKGLDFFTNHLPFEEKNKFYQDLFKLIPGVSEETLEYYLTCPGLAISTVLLENVGLYIENFSGIPYSDEENATLLRFGKVFQQTYTRFLDLQKAEAQAREAQTEAALERVRSRTMAMQHSKELQEAASFLFQQINRLGIKTGSCGYNIWAKEDPAATVWMSSAEGGVQSPFKLPHNESLIYQQVYDAMQAGEDFLVKEVGGDELKSHFDYLMTVPVIGDIIRNLRESGYPFPETIIYHFAFFKQGYLSFHTHKPCPEAWDIFKRFANVFEQTYTRFLDLQKAEAQTREAQIELSLERIRSQVTAMRESSELLDIVVTMRAEFVSLGHDAHYFWHMRWLPGKYQKAMTSGDGTRIGMVMTLPRHIHGDVKFVADWEKSDEPTLVFAMDVDVAVEYVEKMITLGDFQQVDPQAPTLDDIRHIGGLTFVMARTTHGEIGFSLPGTVYNPPEESVTTLARFAGVFDLAYRRFEDLKEAEARALELVRQAALDRVRAEIASMRTSDDLNRITPIVWRELKTLEVPFIRCGVFIVDEENAKVQVYLTTPDGKSLGVLNLSFDENKLTSDTVEHWQKKKIFKVHWNKEEFVNWTHSMVRIGQVQNEKTYQGSAEPPESLDLHFVPFTQGMLYVGNSVPLTEAALELVKSLAEAFSIAYARYEDFKNIEDAKNEIEITLKELRSAQAQLIHAEKMASLGELTAGIAHEIKNPLNFVNNFSDLSRELIEEIKAELQNNNPEEVLSVLNDLSLNLEKINQHGKRADSIVKGMLLHSRGSSGQKALTDINDLLDQYVNLAYHGMRAQNKEFNITIIKDYDKTLEKINVIPQDLSRVFLNIINNACYAAFDRKKKNTDNNFSPALRVSTKNINGKVEIRIGDNGSGIPQDIIDKIFQPFFTTKPTGEGTGLGLSLSYDIITKVHGGELRVETREGEGTGFIINLPGG